MGIGSIFSSVKNYMNPCNSDSCRMYPPLAALGTTSILAIGTLATGGTLAAVVAVSGTVFSALTAAQAYETKGLKRLKANNDDYEKNNIQLSGEISHLENVSKEQIGKLEGLAKDLQTAKTDKEEMSQERTDLLERLNHFTEQNQEIWGHFRQQTSEVFGGLKDLAPELHQQFAELIDQRGQTIEATGKAISIFENLINILNTEDKREQIKAMDKHLEDQKKQSDQLNAQLAAIQTEIETLKRMSEKFETSMDEHLTALKVGTSTFTTAAQQTKEYVEEKLSPQKAEASKIQPIRRLITEKPLPKDVTVQG